MQTIVLALLLATATTLGNETPDRPLTSKYPPPGKPVAYYVCPNDETMLRVPKEKDLGEFKCPVDGTPMKQYRRTTPYFLLR